MEREVLVLTKSEKYGKKCVAGVDMNTQNMLRLVSSPNGEGIPEVYMNNIAPLDIVRVYVVNTCPIEHQTENVQIHLNYGIKKRGEIKDIHILKQFVSNNGPAIFGDCNHKILDVSHLKHSLEIIKFSNMTLCTNDYGKTKAEFVNEKTLHTNYSVTDSRFFNIESYTINSGYAVVSIPKTDDFTKIYGYFKYVSSIIY